MSMILSRPRTSAPLVATLSALGALTLAGCKRDDEARAEPATSAGVTIGPEDVAVAKPDSIEAGPAISGSLAFQKEAALRAEVSGSVLQTYVEQGQRVARGTLLARIDDTAVRDAFLSARSAVNSAQTAADIAQRELERAEKLLAAGAIAERDMDAARRNSVAAQAGLADARARFAAAQQQLENTRVVAPFAGIVSERVVSGGDIVAPGTELFTVVEPSSMRLEASVPAEQLASVRVGAPVRFTVSGYPGRSFTGKVTRVNPVADVATRQVRIIAELPNAGGALVGGLFAEGRVASETHIGIVVPQTAVDERGVTPSVMRLKGGRVDRVTVEVGLRDPVSESVEVRTGLAAGDTVLLGAAQGITAGTPVKVGTVADRQ